jgi:hypothetical protein
MQTLGERFQCPLTAHDVAQEDRDTLDALREPEAAPREAHVLRHLRTHVSASKRLSDDSRLPKPTGRRGNGVRRCLDDSRRIHHTVHLCLLCTESVHAPFSRRHLCRLARS